MSRSAILAGITGLAILFFLWRALPPPAVPTPGLPVLGKRPECPRHEGYVADSAGTRVVRQEIAASKTITLIPEFHDCQRLLQNAEKKSFGPLVAVFVRFDLRAVGDPVTTIGFACPQSAPVNSGSNIVARINAGLNVTLNGAITCTTANITAPRLDGTDQAAITALNYDDRYEPLGLQHGISCIYVYHVGTTWAAQLFAAPAADETGISCLKKLSEQTDGVMLDIRVVEEGAAPPPVTRWDWNGEKHLIGVACGTKWCEIAKGGLGPETPWITDATGKRILKGTYDQQFLAVPAGSELVPGPADGTILPVPWLTAGDPPVGSWTTVANGSLSLDVKKYHKRFKFKQKPVGQGTELALCRGPRNDCLPGLWKYFGVNKCEQKAEDGTEDPWWARLSIGDEVTYRCVTRRTHPAGSPVPPDVVRWRWDLKDEGIWRRCSTGCCEVT